MDCFDLNIHQILFPSCWTLMLIHLLQCCFTAQWIDISRSPYSTTLNDGWNSNNCSHFGCVGGGITFAGLLSKELEFMWKIYVTLLQRQEKTWDSQNMRNGWPKSLCSVWRTLTDSNQSTCIITMNIHAKVYCHSVISCWPKQSQKHQMQKNLRLKQPPTNAALLALNMMKSSCQLEISLQF